MNPLAKVKLEVLELEQNTPEWFEMRKTRRTASETPIVMGLSPWNTPGQLAAVKFSGAESDKENAAMRHGHKHEPAARKLYEKRYGRKMNPVCLVRGDYMSSLDGWSEDKKIVLEIKSPYSSRGGSLWQGIECGDVPDYYEAQVQHQLMISGSDRCDFVVYDSKSKRIRLVSITPDEKFFTKIIKAWEQFIKKYV